LTLATSVEVAVSPASVVPPLSESPPVTVLVASSMATTTL